MRTFFIIITLIICTLLAKADCQEYGTRLIWPVGKQLSNNSIIIINSSDSSFFTNVSNAGFIYLKQVNGKNRIPLTVIQICEAGLNFKQIILKVSSILIDREEYGLFYRKPNFRQAKQVKSATEVLLTKWIVQNQINNTTPTWSSQPKEIRKEFTPMGCGPHAKVIFSINAFAKSPLIVKAVVKNKRTGQIDTCYITYRFGELELGHHMCWGEFQFTNEMMPNKDEYEIAFWLIDENGNSSVSSNFLKFIEPGRLTD